MLRGIGRVMVVAVLAAACESTDKMDDEGGSDRGNLLLQDDNNFASMSSLTIPTIETASAADPEICWTDVVTDLQCHEVDPMRGLDTLALLRFLRLTEDEVEVELTSGTLEMSEIDGYLDYEMDHEQTCAPLSSISLFGTEVDLEEEYVASDDRTYLLLLSEGTTPGVGARSMVFLKPTEDSTNTEVNVEPGCGMLDFSADLTSLEPVQVPVDGPWVIDWRDLTRDSQGNEIVFERIDGVLVGFFEDMTVSDLEEQILDLEQIATSLWEIELEGGRTADLADAHGRDGGGTFPGFDRDADGVWMLALMCSTCQIPSPVLLTVLEPTEDAE